MARTPIDFTADPIIPPAVAATAPASFDLEAFKAQIKAEMMADLERDGLLKEQGFVTEPKKRNIQVDVNETPNVRPGRTWIILAENKNIPRGGQFFGVNGATFLLRPGKPANVPNGLIDVLDSAIESIPIVDPDTLVILEYRDQLRYPYRQVPPPKKA